MKIDVLGVEFDGLTMDVAVALALIEMERCAANFVVTPNPEIVWICRKNQDLQRAVNEAAMVLPDGVGITIGAKILGRPLPVRIPGIDFAAELFSAMAQRGMSVFLYGANPGVAESAGESLTEKYIGLRVVGTMDGYCDPAAPLDAIRAAQPDLLLVCLGAPKQELWMQAQRGVLPVGLMAGLGGALDVFAGVAERAPLRWQKLGLEWLYRLLKEPRRIGRMVKLPLFLFAVTWQRLRGG